MATKILALARPDTCAVCAATLEVGTRAQWDPSTRTVTCLECVGAASEAAEPVAREDGGSTDSPGTASDSADQAGGSAQREYNRRHDRRAARIDARFGRWAPVVKFLSSDPQSTRAWAKGSAGERKLAESLEQRVGDRAVLLHDRKIPKTRANIDHLVIAASGVWVVDAKTYLGRVERRDKGGWFKVDHHLYVGNRDRSVLLGGMTPQIDAVQVVLDDPYVPVHAALCFVDAEWSLFTKPFQIGDIWVTPPRRLAEMISKPGPLSEAAVLRVAERLNQGLGTA